MKKLFLALLAVGTFATVNAQKNTILVYGNAGVQVNNDDHGFGSSTSHTMWNINPGIGYQFNKNMTVGIQGGYQWHQDDNKTVISATSVHLNDEMSEWTAGGFYRYTHYISPMFAIWNQLDLSYISGEQSTDSVGVTKIYNIEDDYNGFSAMITPAVAINVHEGWALNFGIGSLGYRATTWDGGAHFGSQSSSFVFTFGQQFNIGISKNFGCKKKHGNMEPGMDMRKHKAEKDDDDDE
jgi:hypothetical protein